MSYFPNVEKIQYEGPTTENMFAFRHYNPEELVMGKKMKDHLRFAIAYWHTMTQDGSDPFGNPVNQKNMVCRYTYANSKEPCRSFL
jgi:xylose isomerase